MHATRMYWRGDAYFCMATHRFIRKCRCHRLRFSPYAASKFPMRCISLGVPSDWHIRCIFRIHGQKDDSLFVYRLLLMWGDWRALNMPSILLRMYWFLRVQLYMLCLYGHNISKCNRMSMQRGALFKMQCNWFNMIQATESWRLVKLNGNNIVLFSESCFFEVSPGCVEDKNKNTFSTIKMRSILKWRRWISLPCLLLPGKLP